MVNYIPSYFGLRWEPEGLFIWQWPRYILWTFRGNSTRRKTKSSQQPPLPLIYISPPLVPCHLTSLLSDKRLVRSSSAWRRPQRPSVAEIFQFFVFTDRRKIRWSFVTGVESEQRAEGRAGHGGGAGLTGRGSQDRLLSLNRRSTL